eukprot:Sdes_comp16000_c0_seq1m5177
MRIQLQAKWKILLNPNIHLCNSSNRPAAWSCWKPNSRLVCRPPGTARTFTAGCIGFGRDALVSMLGSVEKDAGYQGAGKRRGGNRKVVDKTIGVSRGYCTVSEKYGQVLSGSYHSVLGVLKERGFIQQMTENHGIDFDSSLKVYAGIDPTSDSLHLGNLVVLMALFHFQRHGHQPLFVVGGATGLIGDPSGRNEERAALSEEALEKNRAGIGENIERIYRNLFADAEEKKALVLLNNYDWFKGVSLVSFLSNYGRYFRLSHMLAKESVKSRLHSEEGMSFLEFSYQLFQAYDFFHLYQTHQCQLQIGGSDQWGNIVAGIDLIRKINGEKSAVGGVTLPLLTTSSGVKFGKSMGNAIWLSSAKTSPFQLYQYFINSHDEDVRRFLLLFTFLPIPEIDSICQVHNKDPGLRIGQKTLASEVLKMIHGEKILQDVISTTRALFSSNNEEAKRLILQHSVDEIYQIFSQASRVKLSKKFLQNDMQTIVFHAGLAASRRKSGLLITGGGVYVNFDRISDPLQPLDVDYLLDGKISILRRGKKDYFLIEWQE